MSAIADRFVKRITLEIDPKLHASMRELAKRKRVHIGVLYEEGIRLLLEQPENFMGTKYESTTKKGR